MLQHGKALNKDGQRAINRGILVLLAPPVGFMTIGVGLALRYGKKRDQESDAAIDENLYSRGFS